MTNEIDHPIELIDVASGNWRDVAEVRPLPEQEAFVAPITRYLCLCHYGDDWTPLAIARGGEVVGFVMWAVDTDGSRWIGGLVVDAEAQGRGIGRAAVEALVARFRGHDGATGVALSYEPANVTARRLYAALGFVETGEVDGDEVVARLQF